MRDDIRSLYSQDSDEYLSLLSIESKIKELTEAGILDSNDLHVLETVLQGGSYSSLEDDLSLNRVTIARRFKATCYKISYALGGEFTDEGFLHKVATDNSLTEKQYGILRDYIQGNLRHKIRRNVEEK